MTLDALKKLPRHAAIQGAEELAVKIRHDIIDVCTKNGGHIGASLGAVELALGLHYVFDSPTDQFVWDVGHQAYAHKWLTKRTAGFDTLRKKEGLSGFLRREESEHDIFGAGHSSTSLSAALGIAVAQTLTNQNATPENGKTSLGVAAAKPLSGKQANWTLAIIGDGALTAGLSFEALNQVRTLNPKRFVIVLNDNDMSISPNVGAVSQILKGPHAQAFFESFGLRYQGPYDGNDFSTVVTAFEKLKFDLDDTPILLHFKTHKGRGLAKAELNQSEYHGIGPVSVGAAKKGPAFSQVFGQALCELAHERPEIVAITAAMTDGTGLKEFAQTFPTRFFDVGIAEQHAVTFAAGLATQGKLPVVAIYSTFLQRAIDQIIHDVCLQNLDVVFAIDRAGLVGQDGPTHHGVFDIAYLQMIPNIKIFAPATAEDLHRILRAEVKKGCGPVAIRYPRGVASDVGLPPVIEGFRSLQSLQSGTKGEALRSVQNKAQKPTALVAVGTMQISVQGLGMESFSKTDLFGLEQIKPLPKALLSLLEDYERVIVLEESSKIGGIGSELLVQLHGNVKDRVRLGLPDLFFPHGEVAELIHDAQLDLERIRAALK